MEMKADTVEEKLGLGLDIGNQMERKLIIPFSSLDDLNSLAGTFDG